MRRVREMLKLRLDVGLWLQEVAFRSGIRDTQCIDWMDWRLAA